MNDYILVKNFYSSEDISLTLDKMNNKKENASKVGSGANEKKKDKKRCFLIGLRK